MANSGGWVPPVTQQPGYPEYPEVQQSENPAYPEVRQPPAYEVTGPTLGMSTFGGPLIGLNCLAQVSLIF